MTERQTRRRLVATSAILTGFLLLAVQVLPGLLPAGRVALAQGDVSIELAGGESVVVQAYFPRLDSGYPFQESP